MRLPLFLALLTLAINIAADFYIYRRLDKHPFLRRAHALLSVLLTLLWIGVICAPKRAGDDSFLLHIMWAIYGYWSFYLPKYFAVMFDIAATLPRIWHSKRWHALSITGICVAAIVFAAMWWGAFIERFRLDVRNVEITIPDLPESMKGLRIVQLSDWHVGSYGNDTSFVAKAVNTINSLHPDVVVFTGDIVNRHSHELRPFTGILSRIQAPMGVFSIMGNHDYGEYYRWPDENARLADTDTLRAMQTHMGWHMLDNTTVFLSRGDGQIALIGVENIGEPPFRTYGDLRKAYPDLSDAMPKILLSHNPAHWTDSIAGHSGINIALTLSGHTHAMQIKIAGFSPAVWRYPTWGGLYSDNLGHQLYVNTGLGTVGLPMRIGATPEITVFTLR